MLASALDKGMRCSLLAFSYGQRHLVELESARKIAQHYGLNLPLVSLPFLDKQSSSLLSGKGSTYVPARNILFLSCAAHFALAWGADQIHIGCNAHDFTNYPDCRPLFLQAYTQMLQLGTWNSQLRVVAPFVEKTKSEIAALGRALNAPLEWTWSCYAPTGDQKPCGRCEACTVRQSIAVHDHL